MNDLEPRIRQFFTTLCNVLIIQIPRFGQRGKNIELLTLVFSSNLPNLYKIMQSILSHSKIN